VVIKLELASTWEPDDFELQRAQFEDSEVWEPDDDMSAQDDLDLMEDVDIEALMRAPLEVPLKPAVSLAQVLWARDMVARYPRKSREQISRENGSISWAQLDHYAKTPLARLPERKAGQPGKAAPKATTEKAKRA
jgi:hypothetical protein